LLNYLFSLALALGAHVLEFDVRVTADNVLVVYHDEAMERTTNGLGLVRAAVLKDIKQLDAAYRFTPYHSGRDMDEKTDEEKFTYRNKGLTIPTLREVLERFWEIDSEMEDSTAVNFNIEIKV
jgi:glycerophosphoryl diester phosphodiesterase